MALTIYMPLTRLQFQPQRLRCSPLLGHRTSRRDQTDGSALLASSTAPGRISSNPRLLDAKPPSHPTSLLLTPKPSTKFTRPMCAYAVSLTTPPEGGARGSHLPAHVGAGVPATSHKLGAARFVDLPYWRLAAFLRGRRRASETSTYGSVTGQTFGAAESL